MGKPNTNPPKNVSKITIQNNNAQRNRIQSASNDVFSNSTENDYDFQLVQSKSKRNLSSTSSDQTAEINKKTKPIFASPNKFSLLDIDVTETITDTNRTATDLIMDTDVPKPKPPPPVFVRGILDYLALREKLIEILGANKFAVKSTARDLKIQTTDSDSYRSLIKYLKSQNAEFHTFQAHEDKPFRIVVRNIHPSTPTSEIGIAIEEIGGYTVRNVSNVINKTNKNKLPIFFVDLEPAEINKDIFYVNSLLNTKIKIEEPYKKRITIQCTNCQDYGHSRSYCAHPPRCVKCAANHPTSSCTKTSDQPPVCALCQGNHTANYRGCQVHKVLQRLHYGKTIPKAKISKPNVSFSQIVNEGGDSLAKIQRGPPNVDDPTSFPNLSPHPLNQHYIKKNKTTPPSNATSDSEIALQLSSFINEFKLIINPLISLLTTVINKLMKDGQ